MLFLSKKLIITKGDSLVILFISGSFIIELKKSKILSKENQGDE